MHGAVITEKSFIVEVILKCIIKGLPADSPVKYCCFVLEQPLCKYFNISMAKQQQCGNIDEELVEIDPPMLSMLRSVRNDASFPNITKKKLMAIPHLPNLTYLTEDSAQVCNPNMMSRLLQRLDVFLGTGGVPALVV